MTVTDEPVTAQGSDSYDTELAEARKSFRTAAGYSSTDERLHVAQAEARRRFGCEVHALFYGDRVGVVIDDRLVTLNPLDNRWYLTAVFHVHTPHHFRYDNIPVASIAELQQRSGQFI